jgi:diacylglycerol kinase family enzyme
MTEAVIGRAEELAERLEPGRAPRRRMLVIVNPYATTVSDRLKNLVVYALQARYEVEAVDTEKRTHATQICREAAAEGYDLVVAFGGDGTVNEAANGLVGSETPLTALPGGSTNVWSRSIGMPADVVDATERLLQMADDFRPRRVDIAKVNDRHFVFASGAGIDASATKHVDARPQLKSRGGPWYYTASTLGTVARNYMFKPPRMRLEAGGRVHDGITVVVQNSDPFTFFRSRPIRVCEGAGLETGTLSAAVLDRASPIELFTLVPRVLSGSARRVLRSRRVQGLTRLHTATVSTLDERPVPLEVDGDYIGDVEHAEYSVEPRGLGVVS